jgi:hypothetical protein
LDVVRTEEENWRLRPEGLVSLVIFCYARYFAHAETLSLSAPTRKYILPATRFTKKNRL